MRNKNIDMRAHETPLGSAEIVLWNGCCEACAEGAVGVARLINRSSERPALAHAVCGNQGKPMCNPRTYTQLVATITG
ncbi:MAG: hypothetical protein WBX25_37665 [Rhodomicrobium sp.]